MEKQIKLFLEFLENDKRVSKNTLESYRRDIMQYADYIEENHMNYTKTSNEEIEEYMDYLKEEGKKYGVTIPWFIMTSRENNAETVEFFDKHKYFGYQKDKNIFFLIEHQTKIDYSMPYRILEYEIEIMKSAIDIRKVKNKEYKLPLVIPIVLYTGKKKWDAKRYLEESQETLDGVKIKAGNYNLVDINDFTKEELLQEKTLISKMMLLEKSESTEESIEMLEKIIPNTNKEEKELLKRRI